jgi:hypothetical protein
MTRIIWIAALVVVPLIAPALADRSDAVERKYSGTVVAVDRAGGTIVVEGMGPWRVTEGVTQVERRTIVVMPSVELVRLRRASGAAPSGWAGDFVESVLPQWQVKPGDWVTVTLGPDARRPTATRIAVGDPSEF